MAAMTAAVLGRDGAARASCPSGGDRDATEGRARPVDVAFIVDFSQSVRAAEHLDATIEFVRRAVGGIELSPTGVQVGVMTFSEGAYVEIDYNETHDEAELQALLATPRIQGSRFLWESRGHERTFSITNFSKAIERYEAWQTRNGDRILIFVSDGIHIACNPLVAAEANIKCPAEQLKQTLTTLDRTGLTVYAIGVGEHFDRTGANQVADASDSPYRVLSDISHPDPAKATVLTARNYSALTDLLAERVGGVIRGECDDDTNDDHGTTVQADERSATEVSSTSTASSLLSSSVDSISGPPSASTGTRVHVTTFDTATTRAPRFHGSGAYRDTKDPLEGAAVSADSDGGQSDTNDADNDDNSKNVWIVIAFILFLLVLVAVLAALIIRKRHRRRGASSDLASLPSPGSVGVASTTVVDSSSGNTDSDMEFEEMSVFGDVKSRRRRNSRLKQSTVAYQASLRRPSAQEAVSSPEYALAAAHGSTPDAPEYDTARRSSRRSSAVLYAEALGGSIGARDAVHYESATENAGTFRDSVAYEASMPSALYHVAAAGQTGPNGELTYDVGPIDAGGYDVRTTAPFVVEQRTRECAVCGEMRSAGRTDLTDGAWKCEKCWVPGEHGLAAASSDALDGDGIGAGDGIYDTRTLGPVVLPKPATVMYTIATQRHSYAVVGEDDGEEADLDQLGPFPVVVGTRCATAAAPQSHRLSRIYEATLEHRIDPFESKAAQPGAANYPAYSSVSGRRVSVTYDFVREADAEA